MSVDRLFARDLVRFDVRQAGAEQQPVEIFVSAMHFGPLELTRARASMSGR